MGRFKIYDPQKLVSISNDSNYGKCLLCERKLKNIMGNIKRHYEQMHSVYVNANGNKSKKSRKKFLKFTEKDKNYKLGMGTEKSNDVTEKEKPINKIVTKSRTETQTAVLSNISSESKSNLISPPVVPMFKPSDDFQLSSSGNLKRKLSAQENTIENNQPVAKTIISKQLQPNNSFTPNIVHQDSKLKEEIKTPAVVLNKEIKQQLYADNSKPHKIKLNGENDEIQIPCHSYINCIQISSLDSCHQVDFLSCLIETKTQMNIPLTNFQKGDTFHKALQSWKYNFQFNYSSQTIGEHIDRMAKNLRKEIIKMVANRILYLKLDIASGKQSKVMLINIQVINDFEIKVITLSAFELLDDDIATYLKEKVLTTLERFQIDISNVLSITKDTTKNVKEPLKHNKIGTQNFPMPEDKDDTNVYHRNIDYCQHLSEQYPGHTIHFVACDVIKQLNENISQSRDSAKNLRRQLLQLNMKQIPSLDNATSWFSVYDMMKSLLSIREVIESNSFLLVEVDWSFAIKFVASYQPIVNTALMLQTNNLFVMGDFYREWLLCETELEELSASNELALYLLDALRKRKMNFFENTSFLAALYLDARFCFMGSMYLNDKHKEIAITQLLFIFNKLKAMQEIKNNATTSFNFSENNDFNLNNRYLKLEKQVGACLKANVEVTTNDAASFNNIDYQWVKEALQQLQFEERLSITTNILEYWKMAKYKSPILAKIAEIALAAPATQASINRALNASSISVLKSKFNESPDIINNLLLLKFNQDLVGRISLEK